ncbi:MAG: hypothetical protein ACI835_002473 [Planctomycetota bacterium]|jgi:hypothetical protein
MLGILMRAARLPSPSFDTRRRKEVARRALEGGPMVDPGSGAAAAWFLAGGPSQELTSEPPDP